MKTQSLPTFHYLMINTNTPQKKTTNRQGDLNNTNHTTDNENTTNYKIGEELTSSEMQTIWGGSARVLNVGNSGWDND